MLTDWKTFKLIELYDISSGLSKPAEEFGFGFPFLSFSTVFKNYFIPEKLDQLVNTSIKEQNTCSVKKGDVFLTRTSEVIEELGMSCVALKDYPNATFNGFTKRLRPKNGEVVYPLFIGYYLRNIQFRAEISAYSTLTTRASLNNGIIEKLKVKLPPLLIQQKIAFTLSSYDELIENNKQRINLLEEMTEEIYKEWFVRLRFPGYENAKMVDGLPESWEVLLLGDVFDISLGGTPSRDNDGYWNGHIPWINSGKVNDLRVIEASEFITELGLKKSATKIIRKKSTLLAITGATLGQVSFLEINACTNQSVIGIKDPKSKIDEFIFLLMKEKIKDLINYAGGGAQQHINKSIVESYKFILPASQILLKFIDIIKPQFELISTLMFKNQLLQETRDLLLPRLISGKLSVENLVDVGMGMVVEPNATYQKIK